MVLLPHSMAYFQGALHSTCSSSHLLHALEGVKQLIDFKAKGPVGLCALSFPARLFLPPARYSKHLRLLTGRKSGGQYHRPQMEEIKQTSWRLSHLPLATERGGLSVSLASTYSTGWGTRERPNAMEIPSSRVPPSAAEVEGCWLLSPAAGDGRWRWPSVVAFQSIKNSATMRQNKWWPGL